MGRRFLSFASRLCGPGVSGGWKGRGSSVFLERRAFNRSRFYGGGCKSRRFGGSAVSRLSHEAAGKPMEPTGRRFSAVRPFQPGPHSFHGFFHCGRRGAFDYQRVAGRRDVFPCRLPRKRHRQQRPLAFHVEFCHSVRHSAHYDRAGRLWNPSFSNYSALGQRSIDRGWIRRGSLFPGDSRLCSRLLRRPFPPQEIPLIAPVGPIAAAEWLLANKPCGFQPIRRAFVFCNLLSACAELRQLFPATGWNLFPRFRIESTQLKRRFRFFSTHRPSGCRRAKRVCVFHGVKRLYGRSMRRLRPGQYCKIGVVFCSLVSIACCGTHFY